MRKGIRAGANVPTVHREYECPCGHGRVIEERVPGFGDCYAMLKCPNCAGKYTLLEGRGHVWELIEK